MKHFVQFAAVVLIGYCSLASHALAQVKEGKVSYAKCAYFAGPVEKKSPMGPGKMIINEGYDTQITITGTFNNTQVSDAVVDFAAPGVTFKGKVFFQKKMDLQMLIPTTVINLQLSEGGFYQGDKLLGNLGAEPLTIKLDCALGIADFATVSGGFSTIDTSDNAILDVAKQFAECSDYSLTCGDMIPFELSPKRFSVSSPQQSTDSTVISFANGARVALAKSNELQGTWTRANGDYVRVNDNGALSDCHLTLDNGDIADTLVNYQFDNGNSYRGTVYEGFIAMSIQELSKLQEIGWPWNKFCDFAKSGTLTYADATGYSGEFSGKGFCGTDKLDNTAYAKGELFDANGNRTTMIDGVTEQELATIQAERKTKYEKEKATDYFKFDENGNLEEFQLTYPNLAQHTYQRDGKQVVRNRVTYSDGTVVEMPGLISSDKYKELRGLSACPDYLSQPYVAKRIFPDSLIVTLGYGYTTRAGSKITSLTGDWEIVEPKKENGDYAVLVGTFQKNFSEQIRVETMRKTFPDYTVRYEKEQCIEYPNGNVYWGEYELIVNGRSALMNDPRIRALQLDIISSYDNVVGVRITDGVVCDPTGKIIEIYRDGNKLDEFDFERERIQLQNKLDEERKRIAEEKARKEAEEKLVQAFIQKHGEKNVMAAVSGEIKVGMHVELLQVALKVRGWKISLERDGGNSQVYRIHGMTMYDYGSSASLQDGTIAYVYVTGSKVTSIDWYGNVRTY